MLKTFFDFVSLLLLLINNIKSIKINPLNKPLKKWYQNKCVILSFFWFSLIYIVEVIKKHIFIIAIFYYLFKIG